MGASSEAFLQMRLAVGTGVGGIAVREGRAISVPDYDAYVQTTPDSVRDALRDESVVSVLCAPMIHRGAMVGALYVGSRELTEFRGIATSLLSAMAAQAAVAIRNARLYQEVVQKHEELERSFAVHRTLTDASLAGVGLQASQRCARARKAGVDLDRARYVAIVDAGDEKHAAQLLHMVQSVWGRRTGADQVLAARRGARVVVALRADDDRSATTAVQDMQTKAQRAGIGTRAGVSAARSNLTMALPQAEVALALALAGASGAFVDYAALGPLRFVLDAPHTDEMSRIVLELLGPLAHHHDAKRAELLATLEAYTAAGGHDTTTADSLHIHVSTLKYRLARIAEITGLRLAEPRTRFELTLAFQLRDVLARLGKDPLAVAD